MIDLHTHSLFSDGVLIPSELVYRAKVAGYTAIGLTDHGDFSNFDHIIPRLKKVSKFLSAAYDIAVIPGIEITYVPPNQLGKAVKECRKLGAKLVLVHGETPAETVPEGTNHAAIMACADIVAHPGFISEADVRLAKKSGIALEITTRKGHNQGNAHVAKLAKLFGTKLVLNTDTHTPENLLTMELITKTLAACGLPKTDYIAMQKNARELLK
jgi:histidinol phosphatase-like PHP family hydrolase